jgi:FKBP-type peptidyl-prolyl cis-trans isomerase 2
MDRMKKLSDTIRALMEEEFSGYIRINFSQGSLGRVEKSEEIEDPAIIRLSETMDKKKREDNESGTSSLHKTASVLILFMLASTGCATSGTSGLATNRIVQPGNQADIHYLCRLQSGEIVAATGSVPDDQPKSNIFVKRNEAGPLVITAIRPDEPFTAKQEDPFEVEIMNRLSNKVAGMKEGEKRQVQVTAEDIPTRDVNNYIVRISRVRTRAKEMKMTVGDYQARTHKAPEAGQAFAIDPSFPGRVETVTDQEVVIRFSAKPGSVIETPFGPGTVREEGQNYKVDIDARKGGLTRAGSMIGRIIEVDDQFITIDYRNPFGNETLTCDVTIEKIVDAKPSENGTGK